VRVHRQVAVSLHADVGRNHLVLAIDQDAQVRVDVHGDRGTVRHRSEEERVLGAWSPAEHGPILEHLQEGLEGR